MAFFMKQTQHNLLYLKSLFSITMKTRVATFFLVSVFAILIGCKDETSGMRWTTINDKEDVFTVKVDAVVMEDDDFSLYYTTDGSTNFSTIKPIWTPVKGSNKIQQIVFRLPEKIHPTQLRIDLGKSQNQKEIRLSKIYMSCKGKMVELPGTLIFSYFRPDFKKTTFDATTAVVSGKIVSGIRQSPSLYPKEKPLRKQIDRLTE